MKTAYVQELNKSFKDFNNIYDETRSVRPNYSQELNTVLWYLKEHFNREDYTVVSKAVIFYDQDKAKRFEDWYMEAGEELKSMDVGALANNCLPGPENFNASGKTISHSVGVSKFFGVSQWQIKFWKMLKSAGCGRNWLMGDTLCFEHHEDGTLIEFMLESETVLKDHGLEKPPVTLNGILNGIGCITFGGGAYVTSNWGIDNGNIVNADGTPAEIDCDEVYFKEDLETP